MRGQKTTSKRRRVLAIGGLMLFVVATVRSQTGEWTVYNVANSGLPYNGITALALDGQGTVWIGTGRWWAHAGGGLAKFDGANWTVYHTGNSKLPDNDHVSLSIDPDGNIWSGTENGLSRFDGTNWTVYQTHNSGLPGNHTGAPAFDGEGNAWIATFPDSGLAKFDGANWTVYRPGNSGLPSNFVTDVAIDAHGNVWASTFGSGVARFDGQNWTVYHTGNSALPHNDVSFLDADGEGNVWAGTYGGGLARFDGVAWTPYTTATSALPDNWIWNLSVDPQGSVWAGTKAGLAKFDGARWTIYNRRNSGLPDDNVYCIAFDAGGTIWIGTQDGGLAAFRPRPTVDFNGDGCVTIQDLVRLIESWGQDDPAVDVGPTAFGDGIVDAEDLEVLMRYWGQEVDDSTLVAHWAMDETEGDVATDSGGTNDGTLLGSPVWRPEGGAINGALEFDGAADRVVVNNGVLNPARGPFSVLAWIKGGAPGQVLISQIGGVNWLMADPSQGTLMTELVPPVGRKATPPLVSEAAITDGDWHRVAFVWDGVTRDLYVDDALVAEDAQSALASCSGGLNIGAGKGLEPGTFWKGLIDDVRIYDRVVRP